MRCCFGAGNAQLMSHATYANIMDIAEECIEIKPTDQGNYLK